MMSWVLALLIFFSLVLNIIVFLYLKYFVASLIKSKDSRLKFIKKNFLRSIIAFISFFVFFVTTVCHLKSIKEFFLASDSNNENKTIEQEHTSTYKDMIGKIPFHNEIINDEQIIWEHLFWDELLYDKYRNWSEKTSNFDELRELYQDDFCSKEELPNIKLTELSKHRNYFYGSDILPATDKSLEEVMKEIPPLDERQNADPELFQNEFFLRAERCKTNSSTACLYQIGRAADDAFKILSREHDTSYKIMIFYGSMSVAFYLASIKDYDGNIDLVHAYYRIAEIYLYFERYIDIVKENSAYSQHCLLMAERFLMLAQDEYKKKKQNGDIHKQLPYFSYYYAEILDKYIRKYSENKEYISMCKEYANDYLDSPYSKNYTECRKSCFDILERLKN